jgi:hypothetical protein
MLDDLFEFLVDLSESEYLLLDGLHDESPNKKLPLQSCTGNTVVGAFLMRTLVTSTADATFNISYQIFIQLAFETSVYIAT